MSKLRLREKGDCLHGAIQLKSSGTRTWGPSSQCPCHLYHLVSDSTPGSGVLLSPVVPWAQTLIFLSWGSVCGLILPLQVMAKGFSSCTIHLLFDSECPTNTPTPVRGLAFCLGPFLSLASTQFEIPMCALQTFREGYMRRDCVNTAL